MSAPAEPVRCVLLATGQATADEIQGYFIDPAHRTFGIQVDYHFTGVAECLARLRTLQPSVLLLDRRVPGLDGRAVEALRRGGRCGLVGLLPAGDQHGRLELQGWGVDAVVEAPYAGEDLATRILVADAIRHRAETGGGRVIERLVAESTHYPDRVLAVQSVSGGVGKSTVARELAVLIALLGRQKTALVDLCNSGPLQMSLFLDAEGQADFARSTQATVTALLDGVGNDASDAEVVEAARRAAWNLPPPSRDAQIAPGRSYLDCFFGPFNERDYLTQNAAWYRRSKGIGEAGEAGGAPRGQRAVDVYRQLLKALRQLYAYVVVDVGQDITLPAHEAAIAESDAVLVVTSPSPQAVQLVARSIAPLRSAALAPAKVRFVVNRWQPDLGLPPEKIREAFDGAPLLGVVPMDSYTAEAARLAYAPIVQPLVLGRHDPRRHDGRRFEECLPCGLEALARNKLVAFPELRPRAGGLRWPWK